MISLHCLTLLGASDCPLNSFSKEAIERRGGGKKVWKGGVRRLRPQILAENKVHVSPLLRNSIPALKSFRGPEKCDQIPPRLQREQTNAKWRARKNAARKKPNNGNVAPEARGLSSRQRRCLTMHAKH